MFPRKLVNWIRTGDFKEPTVTPAVVALTVAPTVAASLKRGNPLEVNALLCCQRCGDKWRRSPTFMKATLDTCPTCNPNWSPDGKVAAPTPVTSEILAWRGWHLDQEPNGYLDFVTGKPEGSWFLRSLNQKTAWEGPTLVADVRPDRGSAQGVYAVKQENMGEALAYAPHVVGLVALSGIVVEGTNGYRAERATIRSLYLYTGEGGYTTEAQGRIKADLEVRYCTDMAVGWPHGWQRTAITSGTSGLGASQMQQWLAQMQGMQLQQQQSFAYQQGLSQAARGFLP